MAKVINQQIEDMYKQYDHYPSVAVVVTAHAKGKDGAMAAAWHMPVASSPPFYSISIAAKRFTYKLIADSKEFGVNFLPFEQAELIASVGGCSGYEVDKFDRFNIAKDKSVQTAVPILKVAYAAYECQLTDDRDYGDHRLLVGKIVAIHWQEDVFTPEELLDVAKVSPILYIGKDIYLTTSKDTVKTLDREVYAKG